MLVIDGSQGEAGGQILRTALALAAATGIACAVTNIRKSRPRPGLMAQHLAGVLALQKFCNAEVTGAAIGSERVEFAPRAPVGGRLLIDVGTAGAVTLVVQALLPAIVHAGKPVELLLAGGTHVAFAPTTSYMQRVLGFWLGRMGVRCELTVVRHGFYPKGGGRVRCTVTPAKLAPLVAVERGAELGVFAESIASRNLEGVADRQLTGLDATDAAVEYVEAACPGSALLAVARFEHAVLGADGLGRPGLRAEAVAAAVRQELAAAVASGACVDKHAADQLLPFLALAAGRSELAVAEVTQHALTNIAVIERFVPVKFEVRGELGKPGRIAVEGAGLC